MFYIINIVMQYLEVIWTQFNPLSEFTDNIISGQLSKL